MKVQLAEGTEASLNFDKTYDHGMVVARISAENAIVDEHARSIAAHAFSMVAMDGEMGRTYWDQATDSWYVPLQLDLGDWATFVQQTDEAEAS